MGSPETATISLKQLVEQTRTVYSLPYFYERLNETINHPRSSIADIAKIITEDQGLTARILRLANSPMFGCYARVDSISKAVTIIGTQQLRDLALAASVIEVFRGIPADLMNMAQFWRHSISCGIVARTLATCLRENNVERFFVAGMLHDVGHLVMCTAIPETAKELMLTNRRLKQLYFRTEQHALGFDHGELGGELLRAWKIPANIYEAVIAHHAPRMVVQFPLEVAIVHLADIICQAFEFGSSGEWYVPPLEPVAWDRLGLPVSQLATILKQSETQIEEAFAILVEG